MKLVYIAGPYQSPKHTHDWTGYHEIDRNISVAREAAAWLAQNGVAYICPHLNSAHFEVITPGVDQNYWYEADKLLLDKCDAMLVVGDWESSKGTREEIEYCENRRIPVFFTAGESLLQFCGRPGSEVP